MIAELTVTFAAGSMAQAMAAEIRSVQLDGVAHYATIEAPEESRFLAYAKVSTLINVCAKLQMTMASLWPGAAALARLSGVAREQGACRCSANFAR